MSDPAIMQAYGGIADSLTAPGAPFETLEADVHGAKTRIYKNAPRDLHVVMGDAEARFADLELVCGEGRRWTYRDVFTAGRRLAAHMQDTLGLKPGDHVGIAMRNRPEWFVAFAAVVRAGAVAVLLNSRGSADEVASAAEGVSCKIIIADADRAERLAAGGVSAQLIVVDQPEFASLIAGGREAEAQAVDVDAPAAILFTSGTTGRPKGAVLTHRNLANMSTNLMFLGAVNLTMAARQYGVEVEALKAMMPRSSTLLVFPMFHISGLTAYFMAIQTGGVLHTIRRWDVAAAVDMIEAEKVTMLSGPPLVVSDLLDQPNAATRLASLNSAGVGGQATPKSLVERLTTVLPRVGQSVGWGMTEVSGSVTSSAGQVYLSATDSCGVRSPITDIQARDDQGQVLPAGQTGELWVRGGLVMRGYWNQPEANAAIFDELRWLCTGDVGHIDEHGVVRLVDRKKDMVISGGENIYCAEVERVLAMDHDFIEVSMFGVPDARLGERAVAAVNLRAGAERSAAQVQAFVREHLADYKVPSAVAFDLGAFPRNVTGKVDKAALRKLYLQTAEAAH